MVCFSWMPKSLRAFFQRCQRLKNQPPTLRELHASYPAGLNKVNSSLTDREKADSRIILSMIFIATTITVGLPRSQLHFTRSPKDAASHVPSKWGIVKDPAGCTESVG